jgi:hypothetical protein
MLPDLSGEEICRDIRKKSRVPIIILKVAIRKMEFLKRKGTVADCCEATSGTVPGVIATLSSNFVLSGGQSPL